MNRRTFWGIFPLLLIAVIALALVACSPTKPPKAQDDGAFISEALKACGDGCHAMTVMISLFDADNQPIESNTTEAVLADYTVNAWKIDETTGLTVPGLIFDVDRQVMTTSPYEREGFEIPYDEMHFAPSETVSVTFDITAQIATGWTLKCELMDENLGKVVSRNSQTNPMPLDVPVGLPDYETVHCSWPGLPVL